MPILKHKKEITRLSNMTSQFAIRDMRSPQMTQMDNYYIDLYAKIVGPYGTLVYLSLCRHANYYSQKAFPSMVTIATQMGISLSSVKRGLKVLVEFNIIKIDKSIFRGYGNEQLHNTYLLHDFTLWAKPPAVLRQLQDFSTNTYARAMLKLDPNEIENTPAIKPKPILTPKLSKNEKIKLKVAGKPQKKSEEFIEVFGENDLNKTPQKEAFNGSTEPQFDEKMQGGMVPTDPTHGSDRTTKTKNIKLNSINTEYSNITTHSGNTLATEVAQNQTEIISDSDPKNVAELKKKFSQQINYVISLFSKYKVNIGPVVDTWYHNKTQRQAVEMLLMTYDVELIEKVISIIPKTNIIPDFRFVTIDSPNKLFYSWKNYENTLIRYKNHLLEKKKNAENSYGKAGLKTAMMADLADEELEIINYYNKQK